MQNNPPIYCVVVVYNKLCADSTTCRNLKSIKDIKVIIVDNSTIDNDNDTYAAQNNWIYICMGGNMGLPKAYNKAAQCVKDISAFLCLFDDDSDLDEAYFDCLKKAIIKDADSKIFVPIVYGKHGIYSPSSDNNSRVKRVRNIGKLRNDNITAINNGMAIKKEVLCDYKYDEVYFLDYVDHAFMRDMRSRGHKISIMDYKIIHHTMFSTKGVSEQSVISRFSIFKKDLKLFYGDSLRGILYYNEIIWRIKISFSIKFKNVKMLFL